MAEGKKEIILPSGMSVLVVPEHLIKMAQDLILTYPAGDSLQRQHAVIDVLKQIAEISGHSEWLASVVIKLALGHDLTDRYKPRPGDVNLWRICLPYMSPDGHVSWEPHDDDSNEIDDDDDDDDDPINRIEPIGPAEPIEPIEPIEPAEPIEPIEPFAPSETDVAQSGPGGYVPSEWNSYSRRLPYPRPREVFLEGRNPQQVSSMPFLAARDSE